jgi:osmotically-inducible protein OsmY
MGQRDREFNWGGDRRERQDERSGYGYGGRGSGRREERGSSGEGPGRQEFGGRGDRESYGRQGRGGESMRHDIEDNWGGRGSRSEASDYDYGYGRSGVSGRDYDREYGYGGREYYGGGGLFGGGMGGYTGGGYRGGGLGSNYEPTRGESSYPRENYQDRGERYGRGGYEERGGRENEGWWDRMSDEVSSWFGGGDREEGQRESRRGRGPRGYTRSDDRIKEDINDRLTDHYVIDASDIDVEVNGGEVVLTGTVDSRYEKRLAEDIAEAVSGVHNVENRIRINRGAMGSMGAADTMSNTSATETTTGTPGTTVTGERSKSAGNS